jgi:hypothetical protein
LGFTAIEVSLCGAFPSQSVLTLEPFEEVLQIGLDGFLKEFFPGWPSPLTGRTPTTPLKVLCVTGCGGASSASTTGAAGKAAQSNKLRAIKNVAAKVTLYALTKYLLQQVFAEQTIM